MFHQLWQAGDTAYLNLDTHAGQAWIGLRTPLGHSGQPHQYPPQTPTHRHYTPQSPTNNPLNPSFLSDALQTVVRDMKVFNESHPLPPPDPRRSSRIKLQPISYSHLHKHGRCKERGRK